MDLTNTVLCAISLCIISSLQGAQGTSLVIKCTPDGSCCSADRCKAGEQAVCLSTTKEVTCQTCPDHTYQPDENTLRDRCRLKTVCLEKNLQRYLHHGSPVHDAQCVCFSGYHWNSAVDLCDRNKECGPGFGVVEETGTCEDCSKTNKYSDTMDRHQPCQEITNCQMERKCTLRAGTSTSNAVCGPLVEDVSTCSLPPLPATEITQGSVTKPTSVTTALINSSTTSSTTSPPFVVGNEDSLSTEELVAIVVVVGLVFIIAVTLLSCAVFRSRRKDSAKKGSILPRQVDIKTICNKCKNNEALNRKAFEIVNHMVPPEVGGDFKTFGELLLLGVHGAAPSPEAIISRVKYDNKENDSQEIPRDLIKEWKQMLGDQATIEKLLQALLNCNIQRLTRLVYDICSRIEEEERALTLETQV